MPNGHGGIPKYGSPFVLAVLFAALAWLRVSRHLLWPALAAYPVAVVLGWRLAWHLHLYDVSEYGGAGATAEAMAAAKRRCRIGAAVYIVVGVGIATLLWLL